MMGSPSSSLLLQQFYTRCTNTQTDITSPRKLKPLCCSLCRPFRSIRPFPFISLLTVLLRTPSISVSLSATLSVVLFNRKRFSLLRVIFTLSQMHASSLPFFAVHIKHTRTQTREICEPDCVCVCVSTQV